MRFYFLKNSNDKEVIISAKVKAGMTPSLVQEEIDVPKDFFILLPVGVMTKPLDNAVNEKLRIDRIKAYDNNLVSIYESKHGTSVVTNPLAFQTHLDTIPGLSHLQKDQTDDYKIDINLDEYKPAPGEVEPVIPGLAEGYERITVQRFVPIGASFETIQLAAAEREIDKSVYVAYATSAIDKPAILYVASNLEQVKEMIAKTQHPNSLLSGYVNWTWYITDFISHTLQRVLDVLEMENVLSSMKIFDSEEKPLTTLTFGQPIIDALSDFFKKNVTINTEQNIFEIIESYNDDRRASVCDLITTNTEPTEENINDYEMNTDKAYVRTGFCGMIRMKKSPSGKIVTDKTIQRIVDDYRENGVRGPMPVLTKRAETEYIHDIKADFKKLYILTDNELYFVANRKKAVGVDENVHITSDPAILAMLSSELNFVIVETPLIPRLHMLHTSGLASVIDITNHDCKIKSKLFYIDRSQGEIMILKTPQNLINFDTELKPNIFIHNRVLFFSELRWILNHSYHKFAQPLTLEDKQEVEEEKLEQKTVSPRSTQDIQAQFDVTVKKIEVNLRLNTYSKFAKLVCDLKEPERQRALGAATERFKTDKTLSNRLRLFTKQLTGTAAPAVVQPASSPVGLNKI
jgi:hypothetical protein